MGRFATGVTVVTSILDDAPIAMTANAVASLSLRPPLLLVCADRSSLTLRGVHQCGFFAVNILHHGQQELARRFAAAGPKSFEEVAHHSGVTGAPLLDECIARLECSLDALFDGGDHEIMVGRVESAESVSDEEPLIFYQAAFR